MGTSVGAGKVFGWFANMTAVAGLLTWFGICLTYIRFYGGMKAQGIDRTTLPYYSKLQPYAAWYAMLSTLFVCFVSAPLIMNVCSTGRTGEKISNQKHQFSGWAVFLKGNWVTATFVTNYLPLALFPVLYCCAKFFNRKPIARTHNMDFVTDIAEIEADTYDEPLPRNKLEAFWQWLVRGLIHHVGEYFY